MLPSLLRCKLSKKERYIQREISKSNLQLRCKLSKKERYIQHQQQRELLER